MTDKEIIQALECCISDENCESCPLHHEKIENACILTVVEFYKEILALINRQQAEIEKLNVELVGMRGACNSYKMHYDNAQAEIERLNIRLRKEQHQFADIGKMYSEIRTEAIKEFAERLTDRLKGNGGLYSVTTMNTYIDNLVKEMVSE